MQRAEGVVDCEAGRRADFKRSNQVSRLYIRRLAVTHLARTTGRHALGSPNVESWRNDDHLPASLFLPRRRAPLDWPLGTIDDEGGNELRLTSQRDGNFRYTAANRQQNDWMLSGARETSWIGWRERASTLVVAGELHEGTHSGKRVCGATLMLVSRCWCNLLIDPLLLFVRLLLSCVLATQSIAGNPRVPFGNNQSREMFLFHYCFTIMIQ